MDNTKLISIRLEEKSFQKIEQLATAHYYWKRSGVINNLLSAVLENFSDEDIERMLHRYKWEKNVVVAKFEVTEEIKPYKRK